ncbi:cell wall hydrolase [Pseudomonas sp. NY15435]|uniref:cell wall hydrolase n=1 Tax=Pseudomonas sp. NY15435 TaxID=3400358 RepID=UPI003A85E6FB
MCRLFLPLLLLALWASHCSAASIGTSTDQKAQAAEHKAEVLEQQVAHPATAVASPAPITQSEVKALDPAGKAPLDDALTCLSRTIYWEAKGGGKADMEAVANVVLNRMGHGGFPDTVCGVVKQGQEQKHCQFSWWCDGRSDQVEEKNRYDIAKEIARRALNQQLNDRTRGAMYFHDRHASPSWAKQYIRTAETDEFVFYKPRGGDAR